MEGSAGRFLLARVSFCWLECLGIRVCGRLTLASVAAIHSAASQLHVCLQSLPQARMQLPDAPALAVHSYRPGSRLDQHCRTINDHFSAFYGLNLQPHLKHTSYGGNAKQLCAFQLGVSPLHAHALSCTRMQRAGTPCWPQLLALSNRCVGHWSPSMLLAMLARACHVHSWGNAGTCMPRAQLGQCWHVHATCTAGWSIAIGFSNRRV